MHPVEWNISQGLTDYETALAAMDQRVEDILAGRAGELIWLVEHPPLYTAGTSAKAADLLSQRFPVYAAGRGGEYTYHGPGQRVVYVMLNLKERGAMDVRRYVASLEQWVIATLKEFGVDGFTREGRVGVWVNDGKAPPAGGGEMGGGKLGESPTSTRRPEALIHAKTLRQNLTKAEKRLWYDALSHSRLNGLRFRKQMPIGPYIADFVCVDKKLIIELDGGQHAEEENLRHDTVRTRFLEQAGYRVLRFWNHEVLENLDSVAQIIVDELAKDHPPLPPPQAWGAEEAKIAAIGIRIRKWVTFHGICINVNPDLSHYAGIVPCGIREFGVTSLEKLGVRASMADVDEVLRRKSSLVIS
jgi:lipoyl(octanoyl) transferase